VLCLVCLHVYMGRERKQGERGSKKRHRELTHVDMEAEKSSLLFSKLRTKGVNSSIGQV
jgi:hypothetical protein